MVKEFTYRGKSLEELQEMSIKELSKILPSRVRRKINRGLSDGEKKLLKEIIELKEGKRKKVKTHLREMIILPKMIDAEVQVYSGKEFVKVIITPEMIGHLLGEFSLSRRIIKHSAPGVGATRSSSHLSVK